MEMKMQQTRDKLLRAVCVAISGVTALYIAAEALLCAVSLLGLSHPENGVYAVNTYIIKSFWYQFTVFLLSLTSLVSYRMTLEGRNRILPYKYAMGALLTRFIISTVSRLSLFALSLLGMDGGADPLVPTGGYLIRMSAKTQSAVNIYAIRLYFQICNALLV